ncbi:uncharacterized protein ALTATR162_LOCUS550 [Alternaria atra]|uniref:Polyketide synthase n=1 Tax=Alternaria atra TaxID=119953 RepID=A0A8J2N0B2_9PLEO|nr:uncharacterized protein ALTATR162_LOCUS550 [Alternaria atra]CAG5139713.1 unnamed protein product [Alternaria atra]
MAPHQTIPDIEGASDGNRYSNGHHHTNGSSKTESIADAVTNGADASTAYVQDPVAVVSMACRLPDECSNLRQFWNFLSEGKIAVNTPPGTRFDINTHYDGSLKPQTMASPGGMFLQNVDPRDIDAQFFKLSGIEATSMDPQQRQLLEVVYEGLENAGVTLEQMSGAPVGCFVSSFASDYGDMQARDPENRASATAVGVGRAMLSNRISHFLNTKGPSMTIDTACSGALIGLDLAMRYLQTREVTSAIVAGANLYCSPEHVMDHYMGANGAASLSGKCHTFDSKADGYIKAEAVSMVYLKRLEDAIRDKDPIRAIIRGTATNSDGWTAGIASPNHEAQSAAIRQAYKNAGIRDLNVTSYVEFHGTGTRVGDSLEATGVANVFAPSRDPAKPLRIGSVKSNIGHSEPAAGLSGLLKTVLSLEKGVIPGNPTFVDPSPKIDFEKWKLRASRVATPWPHVPIKRASVNSFGYGGSNAHAVVDEAKGLGLYHTSSYTADEDEYDFQETVERPRLLVLSANSEKSLQSQLSELDKHLSDPAVGIKLNDLAYTLSERKSRHYHRGFTIATSTELDMQSFQRGHVRPELPNIGFVFTGQGAQWPEMGKALVDNFPLAARTIKHLDEVLQNSYAAPSWSLLDEIIRPRSVEHMRLPELSQPLVTALQIAILALFDAAGVDYNAVVGHSSGEIAAAVAAALITPEQAIQIAYYRGQATAEAKYDTPVGMLATGLGPDTVDPYLDGSAVTIACINSDKSVTLSGTKSELAEVEKKLKDDGHFARALLVDAAYHSSHMKPVAGLYRDLLEKHVDWCATPKVQSRRIKMFSSTIGKTLTATPGPDYWVKNMVSPVLFGPACRKMITCEEDRVDFLVEIGPSDALKGPVGQVKKAASSDVTYVNAWKRGPDALHTLLECAGKLFIAGCSIKLSPFNDDETEVPVFISDLPNYAWDHSTKYWHETESSKDWRFRKFVHHDLLGSKMLGVPWTSPTWKNGLRLSDVPWLRDHTLGEQVIFPAAAYMAMAIEAIFQKSKATGRLAENIGVNDVTYKLRNVSFPRMLVLSDSAPTMIQLSLTPCSSTKESWHEFTITSISREGEDIQDEHSTGLISIGDAVSKIATEADVGPLKHAVPGSVWYKSMREVGYMFGDAFQPCQEIEAQADARHCRAVIKLGLPESKHQQSNYAMHPAAMDGCLQIATVALNRGHRSALDTLMPPRLIDEFIIFPQPLRKLQSAGDVSRGIVASEAKYGGVGRPDDNKRFVSDIRTFSEGDHQMLCHLQGLRYHAINASVDKPHAFTQVVWSEDVAFLSPEQMSGVLQGVASDEGEDTPALARVAKVAAIIAHKRPTAKILELAIDDDRSESIWIDQLRAKAGPIARGCAYRLSLPSQKSGLNAREKYASEANIEHVVHDANAIFAGGDKFDLVILKISEVTSHLQDVLKSARGALTDNGYIAVLHSAEWSSQRVESLEIDGQLVASTSESSNGLSRVSGIAARSLSLIYLASQRPEPAESLLPNNICLAHFGKPTGATDTIRDLLKTRGWSVVEHILPFNDIPEKSTVVVLDEMFAPLLTDLRDEQFEALRTIIERECRILWVTAGSQMSVTHPERGLMFGASRSLVLEYPNNILMCLDVESAMSKTSLETINTVLKHLGTVKVLGRIDNEFVERNGLLHVSRVIGDEAINVAEKQSQDGPSLQDMTIHGHESTIRLTSERPGTLDTLVYTQVEVPPLEDDEVEIEVVAAGMNFKDLANAMGFVPCNEKLIGLECTGIVTDVGKDVETVKPGDRVLLVRRDGGCFGNRVRNRWHAVYKLPGHISFVDGTTFGIAVHTAVYGLITLANVQKGQSVLIHSASGGVGLAALDLCKYLGAEVYCTVGTEAKINFIVENYGVRRDRVFSSRSTTFAAQLLRATGGRGVDVCLNSLTGDMLHESWRCIAENGTMIEIGKKDLIDRNSLSMEPFDRNCSYRALDLSRPSITDEVTRKVGEQIMDLVEQGLIRPLHVCKVFAFEETIEAFRYMQRGKHIGKVVISYENSRAVKVPVRPMTPQFKLRPDRSYFIVGGFKGLNSSLAVYLARNGATNIVTISRSGYDDERSQKTIYDCNTLGCHVDLVTGDITNLSDVRRAYSAASKPVAGVIQGAMLIRDRMFTKMTPEEFRLPGQPKVAGTWNLHVAGQEHSEANGFSFDFFTMLSSVSGLLGHMGQSNYAAANAFLDAFASWRIQQGLPACSVDLGPVDEVGYLKDKDNANRRLEAMGWHLINESLLYRILRASIMQQTHSINKSSWGILCTGIMPGAPFFEPLHRFSSLRAPAGSAAASGAAGSGGSGTAATKLALLKNAAKDGVEKSTLLAASIEVMNAVLMRSLGMKESLEISRPLGDYGVDSLVAVEMRNWTRSELGVEMSVLEIVGARTLTSLCEVVLKKLTG